MNVVQSCPTLCNPMDCSPPDFSVHRILHRYWNGLPFPSPQHPPDPGIKPGSSALHAHFLLSEPPGSPRIRLGERELSLLTELQFLIIPPQIIQIGPIKS